MAIDLLPLGTRVKFIGPISDIVGELIGEEATIIARIKPGWYHGRGYAYLIEFPFPHHHLGAFNAVERIDEWEGRGSFLRQGLPVSYEKVVPVHQKQEKVEI